MKIFEDRLKANSTQDFFVGDKLSFADFAFLHLAHGFLLNDPYKEQFASTLDAVPVLKAYVEKRSVDIAGHLEKRPKCFI